LRPPFAREDGAALQGMADTSACSGEVDTGSPSRTCATLESADKCRSASPRSICSIHRDAGDGHRRREDDDGRASDRAHHAQVSLPGRRFVDDPVRARGGRHEEALAPDRDRRGQRPGDADPADRWSRRCASVPALRGPVQLWAASFWKRTSMDRPSPARYRLKVLGAMAPCRQRRATPGRGDRVRCEPPRAGCRRRWGASLHNRVAGDHGSASTPRAGDRTPRSWAGLRSPAEIALADRPRFRAGCADPWARSPIACW